ncbi:MAG TPA: hypothetical protein VG778_07985 [Blastocatellia bacterium]|nr:hypothetical protein [Blastocatellia bacterium]
MDHSKRTYNLVIWGLALGYFVTYVPYVGLVRTMALGLTPGVERRVASLELLPGALISTVVAVLGFITVKGWWKDAARREVRGISIPLPTRWTVMSGVATAVIIATTTLAYTFEGVSILLTLLLLRGGVLIAAPLVDFTFKRRVRWFSWMGLALSFAAIVVALADVRSYQMTLLALLNVFAYVFGYSIRLPMMTKVAKAADASITRRYFVEEQMVSSIVLTFAAAALFAAGVGPNVGVEMNGEDGRLVAASVIVGLLYAGLFTFGTLIYLDRRENTFCVPLNRCSSLLSGIAGTYALFLLLGQPPPSAVQLSSAALIVVALLLLSPLHHLDIYLRAFNRAVSAGRVMFAGVPGSEGPIGGARDVNKREQKD